MLQMFSIYSPKLFLFTIIFTLITCLINYIFKNKFKNSSILKRLSSMWLIYLVIVFILPGHFYLLYYFLRNFGIVVHFILVFLIITGIIRDTVTFLEKKLM